MIRPSSHDAETVDRRRVLARTSTGGGDGTCLGWLLLTDHNLRLRCRVQTHPSAQLQFRVPAGVLAALKARTA